MTSVKMPFGKHKNTPIHLVDVQYLYWALHSIRDLSPWLRGAIRDELDRRAGEGRPRAMVRVPAAVSKDTAALIVDAGRRALAKRYHPDVVEGNLELMQSVNASADYLNLLISRELVVQP